MHILEGVFAYLSMIAGGIAGSSVVDLYRLASTIFGSQTKSSSIGPQVCAHLHKEHSF
jgi:hypothetical protein